MEKHINNRPTDLAGRDVLTPGGSAKARRHEGVRARFEPTGLFGGHQACVLSDIPSHEVQRSLPSVVGHRHMTARAATEAERNRR